MRYYKAIWVDAQREPNESQPHSNANDGDNDTERRTIIIELLVQ